jgi:hypothetical protein
VLDHDHGAGSTAVAQPPHGCPRMAAHGGVALPPAGLPMPGVPTRWWLPASGSGARLLHTSVAVGEQEGGEQAMGRPGGKTSSSSYRGVRMDGWQKRDAVWRAYLWNPEAKCEQYVGRYVSEEDAARAYDYAAVELHGPEYTKRNFPGELISEPPQTMGDERRERMTSRFTGVYWHKSGKVWRAQLWDPEAKRNRKIGTYVSEEDAARAYDYAAVKMHGPEYTERNFPDELISEPPVSLGDEMRERKTSRFTGVCWDKRGKAWEVDLWNRQTKGNQHVGIYASEEDAARAYDYAAVKMHGTEYTERNFPDELISEPPVSLGDEWRERKTSRFTGVCWHKSAKAWQVQLWDRQTKRNRCIGHFASEEDAARAWDYAAVKMRGPEYTKRNFPDELISEPPVSLGRKRK